MKYLYLAIAVLVGLYQLIIFFQNLAGAQDTTIYYLFDSTTMNPGLMMFLGFLLGGICIFAIVLYLTGGKLPTVSSEVSAASEEW